MQKRTSVMQAHRVGMFVAGWVFAGLSGLASGQTPAVTPDQASGVYAVGQPIRWTVKSGTPAGVESARYTVKSGQLVLLREGDLSLTNGVGVLETALAAPGTALAEISLHGPTGTTVKVLGGAIAAPEQIRPSATRPDDFDAFWAAKLAELAKVPANPRLEAVDVGQTNVGYWKIAMDNIRGSHIQGQLARPTQGRKLPAMLIVQWAGVYGLKKEWVTEHAKEGWLTLNISAHDLPIDQPEAFYKEQTAGALKDYPAIGNDDRETSYFLRMYLSCYRAAQYLTERDDWDGQTLVVTGGSQGGLQTLMLAGLHPRITAAIACVPAGCDMTGPNAGRTPGWPMWYWKTQGKDSNKVHRASQYYDVVNFASRVKCPVLVGVGLIDQTCPAAGVFAALNQMTAPKEIVILPDANHAGSHNSHAAYYGRAGTWMAELRQGHPAPLKTK